MASLCSRPQDAKAGTVTAQPEVTEAAPDRHKRGSSQVPELCRTPENLEKLVLWRREGEGTQEMEELGKADVGAVLVTRLCGPTFQMRKLSV